MPIITGDNKETIIQFGDGDILISPAKQVGAAFENEIALSQDEQAREIGAYSDEHKGKTTADLGCAVRLQFTKSASIGVLIERLATVRAQMETAGY